MLDRLSNQKYREVIAEHLDRIGPELRRIDAAIRAASASGNRAVLDVLRTMRVYLASGLFDRDFYLDSNPDLRQPGLDPLKHFVRHGEKEGRRPNPVCWPAYSWDDVVLLGLYPPCEFEAAGGDEPHALMRVKRAFGQLLGVDAAFDCYRLALGLGEARLRRVCLLGLRDAAEGAHVAFHEIAPAGEAFRIVPPTVFGDGDHRDLDGVARSAYVACLIDARVRGRSAIIEFGDAALVDREDFEQTGRGDQLDFDTAIFRAADGAAWLIEPEEDAAVSEIDEAFLLSGPRTEGFGHWLLEYLPKYVAALQANALPPVPVLIDAGMPRQHRQALAPMLPQGVSILELPASVPVRVRRLWCASSLMYRPALRARGRRYPWEHLAPPPRRLAPIVEEMVRRAAKAAGAAAGGEKVFLARKTFRHRGLLNHEAIEAAAAAHGFRIVDPETLDFAEQLCLIRGARHIIAPESPALFLAFFARPGTRLCILSHPDTAGLPLATAPLAATGVEVTVLTGPFVRIGDEYRDGSRYQIDEDRFRAFLGIWLDDLGSSPIGLPWRPPAKRRDADRIALFVGVKDEAETIARMIDHHRALGFDLILVWDVNSTDGTREILDRYRSDDDFRVVPIDDPQYPEQRVPEELEMLKRAGIDWLFFLAADEFCIPASGNLRDCAGLAHYDLLLVDRFNIPLGPDGPLMPNALVPDRYDELLLFTEPVENWPTYLRQHPDIPWIRGMDLPTAVPRPERISGFKDGGHDITAADRYPLRWSRPADLIVAHLPLSSRTRFTRKIENVKRFFAAHDRPGDNWSRPDAAPHWRRWVELLDRGLLDKEFDRSVLDAGTIIQLRRDGVIRSAAELFGET